MKLYTNSRNLSKANSGNNFYTNILKNYFEEPITIKVKRKDILYTETGGGIWIKGGSFVEVKE